jgi:hypothetical protein
MDVYWSVQRCRWEPCSPEASELMTPWTGWLVPEPDPEPTPELPQQRVRTTAAVDA